MNVVKVLDGIFHKTYDSCSLLTVHKIKQKALVNKNSIYFGLDCPFKIVKNNTKYVKITKNKKVM